MKIHDYIIVDDDPTNNLICKLVIEKFDSNANVTVFQQPEEGLKHIQSATNIEAQKKIVLFLDVNMPTMTGWDFLDKFQMFDTSIKNMFEIYILTSAIEDFELEKTKYPMVKDFLSKPLRKATLHELDLNASS
ncbi:CheY-like chemotaxis protein [Gramella sp. Hel_I_59]|uniref:response regulator n=1 Tax=Gramella sp. Hel_I_59 TaxID=1249978 RepID=UPI00116CFBFA|nr:response regulator [Gramella sp. Hel_I_59]TQI70806.1 CheY-like chemotaxis protein [Gramella sp. Hel_I_59]